MTVIRLHDLTFNTGQPDADGVEWWVDVFDGWEAPELEQSLHRYLSRPGAAVGQAQYVERLITLGGLVITPPGTSFLARDKLTSALGNLTTRRWLRVDEDPPKRVGYVRAAASPTMSRTAGAAHFRWSAQVVCPDPLKYALAASSWQVPAGGSLEVVGVGTATTPLAVTTTASGVVDVRNTATGQRLRTTGAVSAGTVLGGGLVLPFGDPVWPLLAVPVTFLDLVPGTQTIHNDGPAAVDITYTNAWL